MRIAAALAFYDEPPGFLTRCVESLNGVVDFVVALDGRWANFPGDDFVSPAENSWEILCASGLPPIKPRTTFSSQVAKRDSLMFEAKMRGADWILVVDADEHITHADPVAFRAALAATDAVVGEITLHQPEGFAGGLTRRLYRAGTTVEIVHTGYTYQGRHLLPGEPAVDLTGCLTITHDYANRGAERNQQARQYLEARAASREETWVSA